MYNKNKYPSIYDSSNSIIDGFNIFYWDTLSNFVFWDVPSNFLVWE